MLHLLAVREEFGIAGGLDRLMQGDLGETGPHCDLAQEAFSQERQMLVATEDEVVEAPADAVVLVRKVGKLAVILLHELGDGVVAAGAAHTVDATGLEHAEHIAQMTPLVGQVLDHVVRIDRIHRVVRKGQRVAQIGPDIAFASEEIGVDIDPARHVVPLARAKMQLHHIPFQRAAATEGAVKVPVQSHQRAGHSVKGGFHLSA